MKRRNADCKFKRPIKRNKITEGMFHGSNTFLYIKFLFLWAIVITADFMLEFRFEFLWPFWLLLRSVHDSFKYKGLAFSVLFVCIAITSDLICLFFIPVNWLFFAASTYVWVQYVWHTEKGICLPTIVLWMLFLYIEGAIRWRDSRHMPHLDLCRPFAAHCIGYPVVTLGFGFKSYVGFRIRQRKQREVAKENEFYMQLLQQALPPEEPAEEIIPLTDGMSVTVTTASNGGLKNLPPKALPNLTPTTTPSSNGHVVGVSASNGSISSGYSSSSSSRGKSSKCDLNHSSSKSSYHQQSTVTAASTSSSSSTSSNSSSASSVTSTSATAVASVTSVTVKDVTRSSSDSLSGGSSREREKEMCTPMHNNKTDHHHHGRSSHSCPDGSSGHSDGSPSSTKSSQSNKVQHNGGINYINSSEQHHDTPDVSAERGKNRRNRTKQKDTGSSSSSRDNHHHQQSNGGDSGAPSTPITNHSQTSQTLPQVCEACQRLEGDVKRMRSDLQHMKQVEHDLRQKVDSGATIKSCLQAKQKENDELEKKIQDLNNSRHVDRQNLQNAEKRLGEERRQRLGLESQLTNERKMRIKVEEKAAKLAECGESCKIKKRHLESEAGRLRRELSVADEQRKVMEQQNRRYEDELRKLEVEIRSREAQQSTEMLMSALAAMQDKNSTLEKNLSAETRFKLDLFSALGEARREVEIKDAHIRNMEKEMLELKGKIAQLLAVMPAMPTSDAFSLTPNSSAGSSMLRLNDTPPLIMAQQSPSQVQLGLGASSIICQLTAAAAAAAGGTQNNASALSQATNCVQQQRENQGNASSTLDPNATAYTPKNSSSLVNGAEA